jgi:hypothetical protein
MTAAESCLRFRREPTRSTAPASCTSVPPRLDLRSRSGKAKLKQTVQQLSKDGFRPSLRIVDHVGPRPAHEIGYRSGGASGSGRHGHSLARADCGTALGKCRDATAARRAMSSPPCASSPEWSPPILRCGPRPAFRRATCATLNRPDPARRDRAIERNQRSPAAQRDFSIVAQAAVSVRLPSTKNRDRRRPSDGPPPTATDQPHRATAPLQQPPERRYASAPPASHIADCSRQTPSAW